MLALGSRLTFLLDDWDFLIHRQGVGGDQFLVPHNEHIVVVPVLIYKFLLATVGMGSQQPFRVVSTALFLTSAVLLFLWLRRRVGGWLGLAAMLPVLFLGSSAEELLWPFPQIAFCGPMAAGLGAFFALQRSDRKGDRRACGLLTLSVLFGSLGLAFVAGAIVHIAWDRERWRRSYVAAIPIGAFAIWWLGWGHEATSAASLHNLATSPSYVLTGFASGVFSLLGQVELSSLEWGAPLLLLLGTIAVVRIRRLGQVSRWLAVVTATGLAFWFPAALNASSERDPTSPRYQYMAAIFILLIAAELLRGVRVGRRALIAVFLVAGVATLTNLWLLHRAFDTWQRIGEQERGGLAGLEIAGDLVDPAFRFTRQNTGTHDLGLVSVDAYFSAIGAYGSPAYTEAELSGAPEPARVAADKVLWSALPGKTVSAAARPAGLPPKVIGGQGVITKLHGSCARVSAGSADSAVLALPPGGALLRPSSRGDETLHLGRYAEQSFPIDAGSIPGQTPTVLKIPVDHSSVPWKLDLTRSEPVAVCGIGAGR